MWFFLFNLNFFSSDAHAGRKADVIAKLIQAERYGAAQSKCGKWNAQSTEAEKVLRENCARVYRIIAEDEGSLAAWKGFREKWATTDEAEKYRDIHAKLILSELGKTGAEEEYSLAAELATNPQVKDQAEHLAISSAIREVRSIEDAKSVAARYPERKELIDLAARYPAAFFTMNINNRKVDVVIDPPLPIDDYKVEWVARWPDGTMRNWDATIRSSLEATGIPRSNIMRIIQRQGRDLSGPAMPLCPMSNQPAGWVAGVALHIRAKSIFEPVPWDPMCMQVAPTLISSRGNKVLAVSLGPTHSVTLQPSKTGRRDIRSFLTFRTPPVIFEDKIYVPFNKIFAVFPLSGAAPYLSEERPGVWKVPISKKLTGEKLPKNWKLFMKDDQLIVRSSQFGDWKVPNGQLRILSPIASFVLGFAHVVPLPAQPISIEWIEGKSGLKPPTDAPKVQISKISSKKIREISLQLIGAGFTTSELEMYDAWLVDLDKDGTMEKVIRLNIRGSEAVAILDERETGSATYIYSTEHAAHGKRPATQPFAFEQDGKIIFAWTGKEGKRYVEWIHEDRGGFVIRGD